MISDSKITTINLIFSLLPQEAVFLVFAGNIFKENLENLAPFAILSPTPLMQRNFKIWTKIKITEKVFDDEELDLSTIISALAAKTKALVAETLKKMNNPHYIENEKLAEEKANEAAESYSKDKGLIGYPFTYREYSCLLNMVPQSRN